MSRTVTIRIINETAPSTAPTADAKEEEKEGEKEKKKPEPSADERRIAMAKATVAAQITKMAVSSIRTLADASLSGYQAVSEDYAGLQNLSNARAALSRASSMATSSMSMAASFGTAFGPAGFAAGAAIGAATSYISGVVQSAKEMESEINRLRENAYSNYFYGSRAGYVDGGRGTNN